MAKLRADAALPPTTDEETLLHDEATGTLTASRDLRGRLRYRDYHNGIGSFPN